MIQKLKLFSKYENIALLVLWVFHISAIIGIENDYEQWFIKKTVLNLILILFIALVFLPIKTKKSILLCCIIFITSIVFECLGTNFGWFFGSYTYGQNLGPKVYGVPLLIGVNWVILVLSSASISKKISNSIYLRIILAALLMVFIDYFLEQNAARFDFWEFKNNEVPWRNYLDWFILSLIFQYIYEQMSFKINFKVALHIFLVQFLFFFYFYVSA